MSKTFDAILNLRVIISGDPTYPARAYRTLNWVHDSCKADHLPDHLIALVVAHVEDQIIAGHFPIMDTVTYNASVAKDR